jgi:DNA-binding NtrC family response regulator
MHSPSAAPPRILVVDDVPAFCQEVRASLKPTGAAITLCGSPVRALRLARRENFDLVVTTLVMRELGGFALIRRLRGQGCAAPVLLITGHGTEQTAIEATRIGVSDYLEKPVAPDELRARVAKLLAAAPHAAGGPRLAPSGVVTADPAMEAVLETVRAVARSDSRVLILGETGTGKQVVAQTLHAHSPRRARPLVEINCAAIPDNLLESELFGHERGAFTGATDRRTGRFEEAGDGTLFLDEVGEMNFALQAKLLRVLQDGRFSRVGGSTTLVSKARVIAATNRDLQREVEAGRFRADLFYRLHVISITLPPLRKRPDDIALLAAHFLQRHRGPRQVECFTPAALAALRRYPWPGNVRELEHLVERCAVLATGSRIDLPDLPEKIMRDSAVPEAPGAAALAAPPPDLSFTDARAAFERAYLAAGLRAAGGNRAEAARRAGLDRSFHHRLLKRHGLRPENAD